jgi:hypothetical protein
VGQQEVDAGRVELQQGFVGGDGVGFQVDGGEQAGEQVAAVEAFQPGPDLGVSDPPLLTAAEGVV